MFKVRSIGISDLEGVAKFRGDAEVLVFKVSMPDDESTYPAPPLESELAEAAAKVSRRDADDLLWRRTVLRVLLGAWSGEDPATIHIERNDHGKPSCRGLSFNASWAWKSGVIAVANRQVPIGVDLESSRRIAKASSSPARIEALIEVSRRFYLPEEGRWLESFGRPGTLQWMEAFFVLWCRKEALVKAWGESIGSHSLECDLSGTHSAGAEYCWNNSKWTVYDVGIPGHFASLCIGADSESP